MISVSTVALNGMAVLDFVEYSAKHGLDGIGIELFYDTLPFYNESSYKKYINEFVENGLIGMHCPMSDCEILAEEGTLLWRYSLDRHKECFELAAELKSSYMVLHTNSLRRMEPAEALRKKELVNERIMLLAEMAGEYGCQLWVENVGFHRYNNIVLDLDEYVDLVLSNDNIYSLIDIGHAHVNGWDIPSLIYRIGNRIRGLHIHDNDGLSDQHLPIYHGNIEWEPVFDAIRSLDKSCERILEYAPKTPVDKIVEGIDILRQFL